MAFPSVLSTFTNPAPTDRLSTTPHSAIETAQNTGIKELQAFIGTDSSIIGTLQYDIRGAGSNGGGHVQTANKGGTGQTAYTKGDLLIATSSSVLTKLAVSANDNDFLAVNSSVATGITWTPGVTAAQVQGQAFSYTGKDSGSGSVYAIYPTPAITGYVDGQLFAFRAANANTVSSPALSVSSLVSKSIRNADGSTPVTITSSTMVAVQYNAAQSYFGIMNQTKKPGFKVGIASQTLNSLGTATIAHGLGTIPAQVDLWAFHANNGGSSNSQGSFDGTNTAGVFNDFQGTNQGTAESSSTWILKLRTSNNATEAATTASIAGLDATNITLNWASVLGGGPGTGTAQIGFRVYA